jgi:hypothetical protein
VADARAREEWMGVGFYRRWRSVRGVLGSTTSPVHARHGQQGATTCGGAAAQWQAAVGTPVSGKQPLGTIQALTDVTHSSTPARRMDRWVLRCLGVRRSARTPGWRGARATSHESALWRRG